MFCKHCGNEVKENVPFCSNCGARLDVEAASQPEQAYQQPVQTVQQPYQNNPYQGNPYQGNPYQNNPYQQNYQQDNSAYDRKVGFVDAIKLMFQNYVNFSGRSSRSEYWWAFLFNLLAGSVIGSIVALLPPLSILSLALTIPGLALAVRRLHDTGKSWVYLLIVFIPLVGSFILLYQLTKPSVGQNQWG